MRLFRNILLSALLLLSTIGYSQNNLIKSGNNLIKVGNSLLYFPTIFSPTDVADLAVWLRADLGITKDGGNNISQWDFENGTFRGVSNVSQSTGANQPTFVASDANYNNQSVISWDGNDYLDGIAFSTQISQPNTTFIVGNFGVAANFEVLISAVNLDASNNKHTSFISASTFRMNAGVTLIGGAANTNVHIFENIFNGASSEIMRDGVSDIIGDAGAEPMKDLRIGTNIGLVASLTGKIAEIIVYNALVSSGDRTLIRNYLATHYNISLP